MRNLILSFILGTLIATVSIAQKTNKQTLPNPNIQRSVSLIQDLTFVTASMGDFIAAEGSRPGKMLTATFAVKNLNKDSTPSGFGIKVEFKYSYLIQRNPDIPTTILIESYPKYFSPSSASNQTTFTSSFVIPEHNYSDSPAIGQLCEVGLRIIVSQDSNLNNNYIRLGSVRFTP